MVKYLLFLLLACSAFAQEAGKVIGAQGTVTADRGGIKKALSRGSKLFVGDSVHVSDASYAKLKFLDDTLISLIAGSEFTVQSFHMGTPKSSNFAARLTKGGLRGATGSIAKNNPDGFTIETPTATMGVRGTIFTICQDPSCSSTQDTCAFFFGVDSGVIVVTNQTGSYTLSPSTQRFAEVPSQTEAPFLYSQMPSALRPENFAPLAGSCP